VSWLGETSKSRELHAELKDEDISILVNNAGVPGPVAPLTGISVEESSSTSPPSAANDR